MKVFVITKKLECTSRQMGRSKSSKDNKDQVEIVHTIITPSQLQENVSCFMNFYSSTNVAVFARSLQIRLGASYYKIPSMVVPLHQIGAPADFQQLNHTYAATG